MFRSHVQIHSTWSNMIQWLGDWMSLTYLFIQSDQMFIEH